MFFRSEKILRIFLGIVILVLATIIISNTLYNRYRHQKAVLKAQVANQQWFLLHRKANKEELFYGLPGDKKESRLLRTFKVKTGVPGERPTPLPQLVGRKYWRIVAKQEELENPETAPYFITLDIPAPTGEPYGPSPYTECGGKQCHWELPGAFGLHGVNGNSEKLSKEDPGSSGCIRHSDEDITYLYNLLDPQKQEIRYYIEDN